MGFFQLFLNVQRPRVLYLCCILMFKFFSATAPSLGPTFSSVLNMIFVFEIHTGYGAGGILSYGIKMPVVSTTTIISQTHKL